MVINTFDKTNMINTMNILSEIPYLKYLDSGNFFLIAGPCVVEDTESPLEIARILVELSEKYQIPFIFKASHYYFPFLSLFQPQNAWFRLRKTGLS